MQAITSLTQQRRSSPKNPQVTLNPSLREDLITALGGDATLVAFPWQRKYRFLVNKRCNLALSPPTPIAITFPKHIHQIQGIVRTASEHRLAIQPRSGGHSYGNHSLGDEDTVIIDLRHFQYVYMATETEGSGPWVANVGAGTRLRQVSSVLYAHGRAIPHGTCPSVGIGGHATVGGLGPTSRLWGLTLDHIEEMTVVLSDGEVVTASTTSHPELFFALRGAAASFGIVVEFKFRTQPVPREAVQFSCMVTARRYVDLAQTFEEWQAMVTKPGVSRKLFSQVIITMRGMRITGTYFGSEHDFKHEPFAQRFVYMPKEAQCQNTPLPTLELAKSKDGGTSFLHHILPHRKRSQQPDNPTSTIKSTVSVQLLTWPHLLNSWAGGRLLANLLGRPTAFHAKSCTISQAHQISTPTIHALFTHLDTAPKGTPLWFLIFDLAGGAINDIPSTATAFAHRDVGVYCQVYAVSPVGGLARRSRDFVDAANAIVVGGLPMASEEDDTRFVMDALLLASQGEIEPAPAVYPGYVDPGLTHGQRAYWGANLETLRKLKGIWDPENVFRNAQSVKPVDLTTRMSGSRKRSASRSRGLK